MSALDSLYRLRSSTAECKQFSTKLAFYEEREKTGRLLNKIATSQQQSPSIGAICSSSVCLVNNQKQIISELASFYTALYSSQDGYSDEALANYLVDISLPSVSSVDRQKLEAPLILEDLQIAACSFPTCKAPGDDGLPMEVYTQVRETLLPRLLEVFHGSFAAGHLPASMTRINVILLLKPEKDSVDPGSYRLISLLQSDVKILAKSLVLQVNGLISSIIQSDQAGFMPQKSFSICRCRQITGEFWIWGQIYS